MRQDNRIKLEDATGEPFGRLKELTPSRQRLWLVAASLWLELMVIIFIIVEMSRLNTPIVDWVNKAIQLIIMK